MRMVFSEEECRELVEWLKDGEGVVEVLGRYKEKCCKDEVYLENGDVEELDFN